LAANDFWFGCASIGLAALVLSRKYAMGDAIRIKLATSRAPARCCCSAPC
jgi:hypothetical protein